MNIDIEIAGLVGFAFAAASLVALMIERRRDVLHGPYIEGRNRRRIQGAAGLMPVAINSLADRLRWRARNMVYLAALVAA